MALHRYGDFRVEVFYFDSPCILSLKKLVIASLCLLTCAWLEIPWHIGRIMVLDQAPGVSGGGFNPHQPSLSTPLLYAQEMGTRIS